MTHRTTPPFRADQVGSLLRPKSLIDARAARAAGTLDEVSFRRIEDDAVREVVKMQEGLGMESVTDGEFRRASWHLDFLLSFENVVRTESKVSISFHTREGDIDFTPPGFRVAGKLGRPHPIFVDHFKFLKSVTKATPKITIPSPSMMHFRGGRAAIDETAYPSLDEFYIDLARVYNEEVLGLAAAGCRYLQIDETNFAYLCDPRLRENARRTLNQEPDEIAHTYAKVINDSIAGRPADMAVTMHVCRGNHMSAWVGEGGYEPVAEIMFNELKIDGFFLEYDDERSGGFEPLRFLPKGKVAVLGLVTTKVGQMESKDLLKRRIEAAAKFCPIEQLALSPQCGFASVVEGNNVSLQNEIDKLSLVVETAREIWG